MHGLIFVTWERYLAERFRGSVLKAYRDTLGETPETAPLASRVYDDEMLLAGVAAASQITKLSPETLLQEFGRYFLLNGLTRHLCAYLLTQVHSARDLLLTMHDAHQQMSRLPDGLTPPLFQYIVRSSHPNELIITYDSPRKLCPVLLGAIEGAAERYGEKVHIVEQTCMKQGDRACCFEIQFSVPEKIPLETPEQRERQQAKQHFARFILSCLPDNGGVSVTELQELLLLRGVSEKSTRPALLLEALHHLHHAGLVATTANQPGDRFVQRRYWCIPTSDSSHQDTSRSEKTVQVYQ